MICVYRLYGIMNEHQVAIGESTCSSKLFAKPIGSEGGKALLNMQILTQIALERSKTAREAIQVIGDLAMQYGYFSGGYNLREPLGLDDAEGEGGEALTISDPFEAWVFHIIPDDSGEHAVWVAQRIPDNHMTVLANMFTIREVDPKSSEFMYSDNLWDVAKRNGWWKHEDGLLNFKHTYGVLRFQSLYVTGRMWRINVFGVDSED